MNRTTERKPAAAPATKPAPEMFAGSPEREHVEWSEAPAKAKRLGWEVRSYDLSGSQSPKVHGTWRWRWVAALHWMLLGGNGDEERLIVFYVAKEGEPW